MVDLMRRQRRLARLIIYHLITRGSNQYQRINVPSEARNNLLSDNLADSSLSDGMSLQHTIL